MRDNGQFVCTVSLSARSEALLRFKFYGTTGTQRAVRGQLTVEIPSSFGSMYLRSEFERFYSLVERCSHASLERLCTEPHYYNDLTGVLEFLED